MKETNKKLDWKSVYNKHRPFDDGALISLRVKKRYRKDEKPYTWVLIHKKLLDRFNEARNVEVLYCEGYLGFRFEKRDTKKQNVYTLRKVSNIKYQFSCKFLEKFEHKKYFEKDLIWNEKDKIIMVKIKLKKGKKIEEWNFLDENR